MDAAANRLALLGELQDYCVARGEPDPRGWLVIASDGLEAGRVHELVVDADAAKVRYLECRLPEGGAALVPIGYARLDPVAYRVLLDTVDRDTLQRLPRHRALPLSAAEEEALHRAFIEGSPGHSSE